MSSRDIREPQLNDVRKPQAKDDRQQQMVFGVALASVVSQVGCVTVAILLGALVVGLSLDRFFDTKPIFTLLLLLGSIPVSLYLLVRIALSAVAQFNPPSTETSESEDALPEGAPSREE